MSTDAAATARGLYDALDRRAYDELPRWLDPHVVWEGRDRGVLRRANRCATPAGAERSYRVMRAKVPDIAARDVVAVGERVIVELASATPEGEMRLFQVLSVRDGRVTHIKDHRRRRAALSAARRVTPD